MVFLFINNEWDDTIRLQTAMLWVPSHGQILSLLYYSLLISEAIIDCTMNWLAYDSIRDGVHLKESQTLISIIHGFSCKERSLIKVLYGSTIKFIQQGSLI